MQELILNQQTAVLPLSTFVAAEEGCPTAMTNVLDNKLRQDQHTKCYLTQVWVVCALKHQIKIYRLPADCNNYNLCPKLYRLTVTVCRGYLGICYFFTCRPWECNCAKITTFSELVRQESRIVDNAIWNESDSWEVDLK